MDLLESGVDVNKSIKEMYEDLSWYNFISNSRLKGYEKRFHEIYQRLAAFMDDVTAVLICSGSTEPLRDCFYGAARTPRPK